MFRKNINLICALLSVFGGFLLASPSISATSSSIETDWLSSAAIARFGGNNAPSVRTDNDALGGCDGIIDGRYGFHTNEQENPWWQVDLEKPNELSSVVIYNRCDWPGRTNDIQLMLSDDGSKWREVYKHNGIPFYGFSDGKPLIVKLDGVQARFVRVQIPGMAFLHLDEVELYGKSDTKTNLALKKPANQSSVSQWSVGKIVTRNFPLLEVISRARKLAEDLRSKNVNIDSTLAELDEVVRVSYGLNADSSNMQDLYLQTRRIVRKLAFSNPLLDFDKILFVKRSPGTYSHMSDQNYGWWSRPGGGLFLLEGFKSDNPKLRCLTQSLPPGSVNSPDLSYDGKKVLFAYCKYYPEITRMEKLDKSRLPEDAFYHIYEVNIDGTGLRKITKGRYDDFWPRHLPNGEIVFLSTRRGTFIQCNVASAMSTLKSDLPDSFVRCGGDAWRPVSVYTLHTMSKSGGNLKAISAFESFEWTPSIDSDGKIIYARWDYVDRNNMPYMKLWSCLPDGTNPRLLWGNYTTNPHCTFDTMRIPGTSKYVGIASAHHSITGGSLIIIDPDRAIDGLDAITRITPEVCFPETEGWPATYYTNPYPLSEDYFLVSWSERKLINEGNSFAPNALGIYLTDVFGNLEPIYRDAEISSMFPIPVRPRKLEPVQPSAVKWDGPQVGTFMLTDVYKGLTGIPIGTIKKLRIIAMPPKVQPWMNNPQLGVTVDDPGKCVLGTVSVENDGSANFYVPSGVSVFFQALDSSGRAVQTMRSLTYVQPGQKLGCVGCHEPRLTTPPASAAMPIAFRRSPSKIAPGPDGSWPLRFDKLVQPALNNHCISCHSQAGSDPKAKSIDLTNADNAYNTLINYGAPSLREMVKNAYSRGSSIAGEGCALNSKLLALLLSGKGHYNVKLDKDATDRLITWMDAYAQRLGSFSEKQEQELEQAKKDWAGILAK